MKPQWRIAAMLLWKLCRFFPIPLFMIIIGYVHDPAGAFHYRRNPEDTLPTASVNPEMLVAEHLHRHRTVCNLDWMDFRLIQKAYVETPQQPRGFVVLGSSRTGYLGRSQHGRFSPTRFFNHVFPGATLEDYLALIETYERQLLTPPIIAIEITPWLFNPNHASYGWESTADEYYAMCDRLGTRYRPYSPYLIRFKLRFLKPMIAWFHLIEASNYQRAVRYALYGSPRASGFPYVSGDDSDPTYVLKANGSHRLPASLRASAPNLNPDGFAGGRLPFVSNYRALDPSRMKTFESLVDHLHRKNVRLLLIMMPYHPTTYDRLSHSPEHHGVVLCEAYVKKMAADRQLVVIGSFNPYSQNLSMADFLDYIHLREDIVDRFSALLEAALDRSAEPTGGPIKAPP